MLVKQFAKFDKGMVDALHKYLFFSYAYYVPGQILFSQYHSFLGTGVLTADGMLRELNSTPSITDISLSGDMWKYVISCPTICCPSHEMCILDSIAL
jgi:hypothetical protein